jgi:protein-disulfide isomerase
MRRHAPRLISVASLIGIAVSAWLLVQYLLPPALSACGPGGGCNTVRSCWLARIGPGHGAWPFWPLLGVVSFGAMLALSLSNDPRYRRLLRIAGYFALAEGAFLIVAQRAICGAFCPFCVITDTAAIVAGASALVKPEGDVTVATPWRWVFGVLAAGSILAAFGWAFSKAGGAEVSVEGVNVVDLPPPIAREQRPNVATIVEFADFECPFCRRQHVELMQVLPSYGSRVRLVRKHVPLTFHVHADGAARAACCAEAQGRGDEMADALFRNEDIDEAGCARHAEALHLDMARYRECLHSEQTNARLASDRADATASGVQGLPTMYIGHTRFEGVVAAPVIRQTIDHVLQSGG